MMFNRNYTCCRMREDDDTQLGRSGNDHHAVEVTIVNKNNDRRRPAPIAVKMIESEVSEQCFYILIAMRDLQMSFLDTVESIVGDVANISFLEKTNLDVHWKGVFDFECRNY